MGSRGRSNNSQWHYDALVYRFKLVKSYSPEEYRHAVLAYLLGSRKFLQYMERAAYSKRVLREAIYQDNCGLLQQSFTECVDKRGQHDKRGQAYGNEDGRTIQLPMRIMVMMLMVMMVGAHSSHEDL